MNAGILDGREYISLDKLDNNRYLLIGNNRLEISMLIQSENKEKTEITIWIKGADSPVPELISGFNRSNSEYRLRIELIKNYTEDQLRAEILACNGPDIFYTGSGSFFSSFNSSAIFEDLTIYMEKYDPEGTMIFAPVINAAKENGRLYKMPVSFNLYTMSARRDLFPGSNITVAEAMKLEDVRNGKIPLFSQQMEREDIWYWLSNIYISNNVNEEGVYCDFETEEYISLLESCKNINSTSAKNPDDSVFSFQMIPGTLRLTYLYKKYGESFRLLSGENTAFSIVDSFAISASSNHKDGAWSFIEYVLNTDLSDMQFMWPVSAYSMDRMMLNAQNNGIWMADYNDYIKYTDVFTDNFYKFLKECSSSGIMNRYPELEQVVEEEAERFFLGQCSAAEAASSTQKRADIFLAERYS